MNFAEFQGALQARRFLNALQTMRLHDYCRECVGTDAYADILKSVADIRKHADGRVFFYLLFQSLFPLIEEWRQRKPGKASRTTDKKRSEVRKTEIREMISNEQKDLEAAERLISSSKHYSHLIPSNDSRDSHQLTTFLDAIRKEILEHRQVDAHHRLEVAPSYTEPKDMLLSFLFTSAKNERHKIPIGYQECVARLFRLLRLESKHSFDESDKDIAERLRQRFKNFSKHLRKQVTYDNQRKLWKIPVARPANH